MTRQRGAIWFKTRHTEPFVVPVRVFKSNAKYVWMDSAAGTNAMRRLRISTETAYFKTEDEALCHVRSKRGERQHVNRGTVTSPSRH